MKQSHQMPRPWNQLYFCVVTGVPSWSSVHMKPPSSWSMPWSMKKLV